MLQFLDFLDWEAITNPIIWTIVALDVAIVVFSFITNRNERKRHEDN